MKLDHIGIEVLDLYAVELFYRKVLGFAPRYRYVSQNTPGLRTVFLERGAVSLELLERPRSGDLAGERPHPQHHLSIEVDDVDAEYSHLVTLGLAGASLTAPRDTGDGYREVSLRDPEGNTIELSRRVRPEPCYPVRAVIFDVGTLVDSEENDLLADQRFGLAETAHELAAEKHAHYLELARHTRAFPEMERFLLMVRERGIPVAAASGSSPSVLGDVLAAAGLSNQLDVVVSAEEVARGKPAPDVFLEAARRLGVPPHSCVTVEDSRHGVEASCRAWMRCIAIPYLVEEPLADAFIMADLLFEQGMATFDAGRAMAWLEPLV
jgi:HAD superfamily hydrolase (TIGR01509 family)